MTSYPTKVSILGEPHSITFTTAEECPEQLDGYSGRLDHVKRAIYVAVSDDDGSEYEDVILKEVLRHEIIHAFLWESGLDVCSPDQWACNEEMVDWIAMQFPKMVKAMKEAKAL